MASRRNRRQRESFTDALGSSMRGFMQFYNQLEGRRMQQENMIMNLARDMDPVAFVHDKHQLQQKELISELEDDITGLFKQTKRYSLDTNDLMNFQTKVGMVESMQRQMQARDQIMMQEAQIMKEDQARGMPMFNHDEYRKRMLAYTVADIWPSDNTFVKVNPVELDTWLGQQKLYDGEDIREIHGEPEFYGDNNEFIKQNITTVFGPADANQWVKERQHFLSGQYYNNPAVREGVSEAFYNNDYIDPRERQTYMQMAQTMNANKKVGDPSLGIRGDMDVTPEYLWLMNYGPGKIQASSTSTIRDTSRIGDRTDPGDPKSTDTLVGDEGKLDRSSPVINGNSYPLTYVGDSTEVLNEGHVSLGTGKYATTIPVDNMTYVTKVPGFEKWNDEILLDRATDVPWMLGGYNLMDYPRIVNNQPVYMGDEEISVEIPFSRTGKKGFFGRLAKSTAETVTGGFVSPSGEREFVDKVDFTFKKGKPIPAEVMDALSRSQDKNAQTALDAIEGKKVAFSPIRVHSSKGGIQQAELSRVMNDDLSQRFNYPLESGAGEEPGQEEKTINYELNGNIYAIPESKVDEMLVQYPGLKRVQ